MRPTSNLDIRAAGGADSGRILWAVEAAAGWNPQRVGPSVDLPGLARYHRGWGRRGDLGVIAELDGRFVGVAFCRLFDEEEPGYGFVDPAIPELGVAAVKQFRGRGIGTLLVHKLAEAARRTGVKGLSLSVDWYARLGYREVAVDGSGVRMLAELNPPS